MDSDIKITESCGNVFEDIGLHDAEQALARAELALRISDIITERGLTQLAAARILGIDQPKVSALFRGHLEGFSTDQVTHFLNELGNNISLVADGKNE